MGSPQRGPGSAVSFRISRLTSGWYGLTRTRPEVFARRIALLGVDQAYVGEPDAADVQPAAMRGHVAERHGALGCEDLGVDRGEVLGLLRLVGARVACGGIGRLGGVVIGGGVSADARIEGATGARLGFSASDLGSAAARQHPETTEQRLTLHPNVHAE